MLGHLDGSQQLGQPPFGARQLFVAGGEDATGDEHLPQIVGGPSTLMMIERVVGGGEPAGGKVGKQAGARALAQPVQRRARGAGRADRLEHAGQFGRDAVGRAGQQRGGAPPQTAPRATTLLVELVLQSTVAAGVGDRHSGAVGAGGGVRPGWGDQPPLGPAGGAAAPVAQRGGVARIAQGSFTPADRRWAVVAAAGAGSARPRGASSADRSVAGGEGARPQPPAHLAGSGGQPITADTDVGLTVVGPHGDRGGLAAYPAPALPSPVAAAGLADRLTVTAAPGDRLDGAAVRAGRRVAAGGAPLAHATVLGDRQRPSGAAADHAPGLAQGGRAAGDQLGDQPPHRGWCAPGQRVRVGLSAAARLRPTA